MTDALDALNDDVADLHLRVAALERAITTLADGLTEQAANRRRQLWCWPQLSSQEASQALQELGEWVVDVLVNRYPEASSSLQTAEGCWYRHPDVVDELSALYVAWHGLYRPDASTLAGVEWLGRALPDSLARCRQALRQSRCQDRPHGDRQRPVVTIMKPGEWQSYLDSVAASTSDE